MEEPIKKAFDSALDFIKQLITLSTGTLALTATFLKDILKPKVPNYIPHLPLLYITWGLMLLSIFFGLCAHGVIVGVLEGADIVPDKRLTPYSKWAIFQSVTFYLGIVCLIWYVSISM